MNYNMISRNNIGTVSSTASSTSTIYTYTTDSGDYSYFNDNVNMKYKSIRTDAINCEYCQSLLSVEDALDDGRCSHCGGPIDAGAVNDR